MSAAPRCRECGKLTFATRQRAEEAAYRLQLDHGTKLHPYMEHGAWHLTGEAGDSRQGFPSGGHKKSRRRRSR